MRELGKIPALSAAAVVLGTMLLAAPAAVAAPAACTWQGTELPLPAGYSLQEVASGDGAGAVAGTVRRNSDDISVGVVWRNGTPSVLSPAFGLVTHVNDINRSGVAVGYYSEPHVFGGHEPNHAIRYVNGSAERLPEPPGYTSTMATQINDSGDIVGQVATDGQSGVAVTAVWPANAPGTVKVLPPEYGGYQVPAGVDENGTVVTAALGGANGRFQGYVWPQVGPVVPLASDTPGEDVVPRVVMGSRAGGYRAGSAVVWNLDGTVARTLPELQAVSAMNASGAIVGHTASDGSLVFVPAGGGPQQVVVAGGNGSANVAELTEDNVIYGEYSTSNPYSRKAMKWGCS